MFETLGLGITPVAASLWLGALLGLCFGGLAQVTRFCLRRALVGPLAERAEARAVWAMALAVAVAGTQGAVAAGLISFEEHRFGAERVPVVGLVLGGVIFGLGMVMARGCLARLSVLSAAGNLRALVAVLVAALAAQATLQGALAPLRMALGRVSVDLGALPGAGWLWAAVIAGAALLVVLRGAARWPLLLGGALIGGLVPLAWIGTGFVLYDEFDPIAMEGLGFTGPWAEVLFWGVAAQVTGLGFGGGLIGGVVLGALIAAVVTGQFRVVGFESTGQMGRSLGGAVLMGVGGVLAGGCSVGAGLAGLPSLGMSAIIAFGAMGLGIYAGDALFGRRGAAGGLLPAQ